MYLNIQQVEDFVAWVGDRRARRFAAKVDAGQLPLECRRCGYKELGKLDYGKKGSRYFCSTCRRYAR